MILHIDDSMTVADVQDKFSRCFPALKLEFYTKPHHYKEASLPGQLIDSNVVLSAIRKRHTPENITLTSKDKAGSVEKIFKKIFGLNAQVLRKVNDTWFQTSKTDTYTLKELSDLSAYPTY